MFALLTHGGNSPRPTLLKRNEHGGNQGILLKCTSGSVGLELCPRLFAMSSLLGDAEVLLCSIAGLWVALSGTGTWGPGSVETGLNRFCGRYRFLFQAPLLYSTRRHVYSGLSLSQGSYRSMRVCIG